MKIFEWLAELRYRNPLLFRIGMIHFILGVLLLPIMLADHRQLLGINVWMKPFKFCLSIGIYVWTMGWIMFDLPNSKRFIKYSSITIATCMIVEMAIILYQAARGTTSHYNMSSALDSILFASMGILVGINVIIIVLTFIYFLFKKPKLDSAYLLSIRLAFVIFIVGNWIGGQMIKMNAHTIGAADGGPGIPVLNWSTVAGDLRIGHFIGLHALQIIPLFSWGLMKRTSLSLSQRRMVTIIFFAMYGALVSYCYRHAAQGLALF